MQYGAATITGFDVDLGGDYMLTLEHPVRARGAPAHEHIGFKFDGTGELTDRNGDADPGRHAAHATVPRRLRHRRLRCSDLPADAGADPVALAGS